MLRDILVKDFAIVEQLALEFESGMTAMTGETGAGKSILVDALGLVLGERANSSDVRAGVQRAEVAASFDVNSMERLQQWLREHDLDSGDECLLRRIVSSEGRSRAFVNGTPVPAQLLKELGDQLVDIHGQHEHQSLLRRDHQRDVLDHWANNGTLVATVQRSYLHWRELRAQLEELRISAEARHERLQLLEFQVRELEALGLQADEVDRLDEEHSRLATHWRVDVFRLGGPCAQECFRIERTRSRVDATSPSGGVVSGALQGCQFGFQFRVLAVITRSPWQMVEKAMGKAGTGMRPRVMFKKFSQVLGVPTLAVVLGLLCPDQAFTGSDTVGLFDTAKLEFLLKNANRRSESSFKVKPAAAARGWIPLAGNWTGGKSESVGFYDPASSRILYLAFHFEQEHQHNYPGPPIPVALDAAA